MAAEKLRGDPTTLKQRPGKGYFGEVYNEDEPELFATECRLQHQDWPSIPLLVPTLSRAEIAHLVSGGDPTMTIKQKALRHASERALKTIGPFACCCDQTLLPED